MKHPDVATRHLASGKDYKMFVDGEFNAIIPFHYNFCFGAVDAPHRHRKIEYSKRKLNK